MRSLKFNYFITVSLFLSLFIHLGCSHRLPKDNIELIEKQASQTLVENSNEYQFANDSEIKLISPGDLIAISYGHDSKLNGQFRVAFDGTISLPYKVKEVVIGQSLAQLSKLIRSKYVSLFNNVDEIIISIVERKRWLQVTGDVSPAGYRLVELNSDITQILAQKTLNIGAETEERKKLKFLKIKWKDQSLIIDLKKYFNNEIPWNKRQWHGGEILSFQSNISPDDKEFPMVRVMGEVSDPGSFQIENGKDFFTYVLKAGGVKSTANIDNVYLIRGGQFQRKVFVASLDEIADFGLPQPNDTLLLFQDRPSQLERRLQMAASIASILSAITIFGMVF